MEATFALQRRVEFSDTDMAGIAHFTNYFRYMEEAEHAFLRKRGLSVVLDDEKGKLGFPKVSATCDFKRPACYEDVLDLLVHVHCDDGKTIRYECEFRHAGEEIARGRITVAFCRFPRDQPPYPIPLSDEVLRKMFGD